MLQSSLAVGRCPLLLFLGGLVLCGRRKIDEYVLFCSQREQTNVPGCRNVQIDTRSTQDLALGVVVVRGDVYSVDLENSDTHAHTAADRISKDRRAVHPSTAVYSSAPTTSAAAALCCRLLDNPGRALFLASRGHHHCYIAAKEPRLNGARTLDAGRVGAGAY